jgi:hypothetical protein
LNECKIGLRDLKWAQGADGSREKRGWSAGGGQLQNLSPFMAARALVFWKSKPGLEAILEMGRGCPRM